MRYQRLQAEKDEIPQMGRTGVSYELVTTLEVRGEKASVIT